MHDSNDSVDGGMVEQSLVRNVQLQWLIAFQATRYFGSVEYDRDRLTSAGSPTPTCLSMARNTVSIDRKACTACSTTKPSMIGWCAYRLMPSSQFESISSCWCSLFDESGDVAVDKVAHCAPLRAS